MTHKFRILEHFKGGVMDVNGNSSFEDDERWKNLKKYNKINHR